MSEPITEQTSVPAGSQIATEPNAPQQAEPATAPVASEPNTEASDAPGNYPPTLESLQGKSCPNCHTGVLYVTRYDPEALHEQGQDLSAQNQNPSGGAYQVYCFNCTYSASHPFGQDAGA